MPNLIEKINTTLRLQNYSPKTIKMYTLVAKSLYCYFQKPLGTLSNEHIEHYLQHKLDTGSQPQTIRVYVQAIHFIMFRIYNRHDFKKIPYAKRLSKLPPILSQKEIHRMLELTTNQKHQTLLALAYAAGLRVSEVVNLKICDLDFETNTLTVRQGKGQKDRLTIFSKKLIVPLHALIKNKSPHQYVFESAWGGKLTTNTAQKVFKQALQRAGITKPATFHSFD